MEGRNIMKNDSFNKDVTEFLNSLNHPLRNEIEYMRKIILNAGIGLTENIKWNGPNYSFNREDRVTMRIQPPKQIQLILHRGSKVIEQPTDKLIEDEYNLLVWRENDRAIATFKSLADMEINEARITELIKRWIKATST
jgi:hypothetical protein